MARRPIFALAALLAATGAGAAATPGLVIDASSGKVLFAERATDPWFPASITKLMTTYVALDQVRQGRVSLNSLLTLSATAAAEPPSKMGFKPGTQLTLDNALKIIMVKSANDIAWMIGENLGGGSIERFADMMNEASRRLGMHESRWVNPNGLPDERQQTSARDMAILARALLTEFPEQEDLFRIGALKLGRQIIRNHNGMLGRYPGADGMKTGFICMGGFNIVASASQNGRRLIAVVMGYPSARERDLRAADLFDQSFGSFGWGAQQVESLPPSSLLQPPNVRSSVCGPHKRQPEEDDETAVVAMRGSGSANSDNPIASLFSPATFAVASAGAARSLGGGRTSLGPRVQFEPIPIWLGPSPGAVPDDGDAVKPATIRIGARPVRTKAVAGSRATAVAAAATLTPTVPPSAPGEGEAVAEVQTTARPGGREALRANLEPTSAAEARPKLGGLGGGAAARPKLGAIPLKPTLPVASLDAASLPNLDPRKPPAKVAAPAKIAAAATAKVPARPRPTLVRTAAKAPAKKPAATRPPARPASDE